MSNSLADLPPSVSNLVEVLRWRAAVHPTRPAFTFLADGEREVGTLTYAALDLRARAIAGFLADRAKGAPVLLCYPPGLEFIAAFMGCAYAGALAVPAYVPRNQRHVARIQAIIADSQAPLVLSGGSPADDLRTWLAEAGDAAHVEVIDSHAIAEAAASDWRAGAMKSHAPVLLQYTSGSTSSPKGVMVSHDGLLRNVAAIRDCIELSPDSLTVSWLPLFHDMGLVLTLVAPMIAGSSVVMMAPAAFVQRPARWLNAVSRYRATHSGGPNFALDLAVDRTTQEQREQLDLSAWTTCYNGSEPLRKSTLDRFGAAFAASGFSPRALVPMYGLAEATLVVTSKRPGDIAQTRAMRGADLQRHDAIVADAGEAGAIDVVSCGPTVLDTTVDIVDPKTRLRVQPGKVGEFWVRGPGVALGYWKRPQATEEVFRAHLADSGEGPFLRTGDLGYFEDGEYYITGRIKDVVILRGQNHYPNDIELTVENSHPALKRGNGAAFGATVAGEERLVVVQEVERTSLRGLDVEATLGAIREAVVAAHEVDAYELLLVAPLEVPKTSSGKIQRSRARERYLAQDFKVVGRWRAPDVTATPVAATEPVPVLAQSERQRAIEQWLIARIAALRGVALSQVDATRPFSFFGIDSIVAVQLAEELGQWLQRSLPPTLLYECPDIRSLSRQLADSSPPSLPAARAQEIHEPIAIVGMACRFPGADSPQEYWEKLRSGADLVVEVPSGRWPIESVAVGEPGTPGQLSSLRGGFIGGVDLFDAEFFGISPREAVDLDPQQRVLLEVTWSALEDAGIAPTTLVGTDTGVFVGVSTRDYAALVAGNGPRGLGPYYGTGTAASAAAGRLSYVLGLEGPSLVVDTACSSSLVAVHLAAQSLRSGECTTALASGVNLLLSPDFSVALSQARMLSPQGRCRTFDAAADGYVRGEGCGVVVLKRLSDAVAQGNPILGVLRGTAVNHDGRSNGLTAPSARAQERVVRAALRAAGVQPEDVGYVEAHGTGTALGDPIEVNTLARVFGERQANRDRACLGSVKTNIGHLEAAAGIAGLIKAVLSLQHGEIPAHLYLDQPNPAIDWETLPFEVPRETMVWPAGRSRRVAGVSSFGFVGTNAHVIIEAAPEAMAKPDRVAPDAGANLLCLSASTAQALDALVDRYISMLSAAAVPAIGDVCAAAARGRAHLRHRLALVAGSTADLLDGLRAAQRDEPQAARVPWRMHRGEQEPGAASRVVFLFTGQGSQYAGMARQLYASEPAFRRALDRCIEAFQAHLGTDLLALLHPESSDDGRVDQTEFSQPALFAVEWALAQMWRSWGVNPSALIGHSVGEIVAACVAGVFTLEDAAGFVVARGRAMQQLPSAGAMVAVAASESAVTAAIAQSNEAVAVAAVNAPAQCVISGAAEPVRLVTARLEESGIACEPLNVSHAFHSALMEPALDGIDRALARVKFHAPSVPVFTNLAGREAAPGEIDTPGYWRRQVLGTVRFGACVEAAWERGFTTFLEIGPQPTLTALARQTAGAGNGTWASSLRRRADDRRQVIDALATLYADGVDVDWEAVYRGRECQPVSLPPYPFQRRRFWTDAAPRASMTEGGTSVMGADGTHALLGQRLSLAAPSECAWTRRVSLATEPWLADHQVESALVYPGMGFIEAGNVAACEVLGAGSVELTDMTFEHPLVLDAAQSRDLQVHVALDGETAVVRSYSRETGSTGEWIHHCSMRACPLDAASKAPSAVATGGVARCTVEVPPQHFYAHWHARGNEWGTTFQGIVALATGPGEALARIEVPAGIVGVGSVHPAHPAILDACVQVLAAAVNDSGKGAFVGKSMGAARLHAPLGEGRLSSHAVLRNAGELNARTVSGDVSVSTDDGQVVLELIDVRFEFIDVAGPTARGPNRWLHVTEWVAPEPIPETAPPCAWVIVHAAADEAAAGSLANAFQTRGHRARTATVGDEGADDADGVASRLEGVAAMTRELSAQDLGASTRLIVLTRGAWLLPGDVPSVSPYAAAAWGFGRTLEVEHRELSIALVDLDPAQVEVGSGIDAAAAHLCSASTESQLAVRGPGLLVPRLCETSMPSATMPRLRPDSTYLVTGGLGTLGLRVARWLAEQGCRHLVLMGRTPLPARAQWQTVEPTSDSGRRIAAVLAIEALGVRVHVVAVDVTDEAALATWLAEHRLEMRPAVRGVVHAAGVLVQSPSLGLTRSMLRDHLAAKLFGAHALDRLFADDELEAFVLFSSASSLLGSPGLAAYAAANSGLDALAAIRRERGASAISVQWGAWAGGGMARAAAGEGGALAEETIDPARALEVLGRLWRVPEPVVAVLPIDWKAWETRYPSMARAPFLSRLMRPSERVPQDAPDRVQLLAAAPAQRHGLLMRWLARQIAEVLRVAESSLEPDRPLTSLGFDSLMALEIRNQVQHSIEIAIPLVELIRGATLDQLVRAILDRLGGDRAVPVPVAAPAAQVAASTWPLSQGQQAQWLLHSLHPDSASYHVAFSARVCSTVNVEAMRRAWHALRERHPILRTRWSRGDAGVVQRVMPVFGDSLEVSSAGADAAALQREVVVAYRRSFDLEHGEVARLHLISRSDEDHVMLLVAHHIACDGWSLWILVDELKALYAAECAGRPTALAPLSHSYFDFVGWERSLLEGAEGERQWQYWRERLAGELPTLDLPTDRPRGRVSSGRGASHELHFPAGLRDAIAQLAQAQGVTVFTVLAAGLTTLLHRYCGQDDFLIGMPATGRTESAFAGIVGHFVNQVVLRADLSGEPTFATVLDRTRESVLGAMAAQDLPFPELVHRLSPDRDPARSPLFQVNFVFQQAQQAVEILDLMSGAADAEPIDWAGLQLRPHVLHQQEGQFDLTVEVLDTGDALRGALKYDPDLFDPSTIERLEAHYLNLLAAAARNPDRSVGDLELLSTQERARHLVQWSGNQGEWPVAICLQRRFEAIVHTAPDSVALTHEGGTVSYAALNRRANQLAARLRREGVGPEVLVALLFEPGVETIVALLAVLKAGGVYLPLDASYPAERHAFMLKDSGASVLVTGNDGGARLAGDGVVVIDVDREADALDAEADEDVASAATPQNGAYCIYTSGTTGRPKGVLVEHRQVLRLFDATADWFGFDSRDVWTLFHSYAFDFSVWEIWGALLHGGRLVIVPRGVSRSPDVFRALVAEQGVTVLNQTPSAFRQFVDADVHAVSSELSALRLVIFGGEALDVRTLEPWFERHDAVPGLVNMYGITETTVHVTYAPIGAASTAAANGIGVPIPDLNVYLLDERMQPVPVGVRGQIYVGGAGLARGYVGRAGLTAERFVPHPFSGAPGARLYRTGDLGRYRADGTIEYLGRIDRQVKIRGFRIERGEIEAALRDAPGVRDAIVDVREGAGGEPALVAYVAGANSAPLTVNGLREQLRRSLPEYMVPSAIHLLDAFPLTSNGKVDAQALAALGGARIGALASVEPSGREEQAVAAVWREVLGVEHIGLHDNFFDLGGHSLLVPQVQRRLKEHFDTDLSIVDLFRHTTVADLATHLAGAGAARRSLDNSVQRARLRQARRGGRARGAPAS